MKKHILSYLFFGILFESCNKMDLVPLSQGSSESWYSTNTEIRMSLDYLYGMDFWNPNPATSLIDPRWLDSWSDDLTCRNTLNWMTNGSLDGNSPYVVQYWGLYYKAIASANLTISKLENTTANINADKLKEYIGEAKFFRAAMYSRLVFYWGDVPYTDKVLSIEEAFAQGRTAKSEVLKNIYADFDDAAATLPAVRSGVKYVTKGAALAMKARIALYMGDYAVARDAAKACMGLDVYKLYPKFGELFLSKTKNSVETIFAIPRSAALNVNMTSWATIYEPLSRIKGAAYVQPSWDLFSSFLCTDGLPIDKSPLYNPRKPFENRDPRCNETIVEHGTIFGYWKYEPHPDTMTVANVQTGEVVPNTNNRAVIQWGSFNGLAWKKGIDIDWYDDNLTDPDQIIIRYADVLLIYAEAMIELNTIDESVLKAMNDVRERAYNTATISYPQITTTDQSELRKTLRIERRMEFAFEAQRYQDIIRWKLAEKVLNKTDYGLLDPAELREKVVQKGLWFMPGIPTIDDDGSGSPDFSALYSQGLIKLLSVKVFDKTKQYLWPIPSKELLINSNMTQNPGY
ncbi:MAG: RagB/SusD family nutrient uptake outer membrane protein [Chitinophagaceae bacterium]|nr:RagB/SusD family nutrient uptake outer membrane protein [Chitinophagaceae bacterium]